MKTATRRRAMKRMKSRDQRLVFVPITLFSIQALSGGAKLTPTEESAMIQEAAK
jgi:hypothetical protein